MTELMLIVVYGGVFCGVFMTVNTVSRALLRQRRTADAINRRLELLTAQESHASVRELLLREAAAPRASGAGLNLDAYNVLRIYKQSGLRTPLWQIVGLSVGAACAIALASTYILTVPPVQIALAIGLTPVVLLWYLRRARAKNCEAFSEQLPDAIDVAIRSLKAGHPFVASLGLVAEEMPDPVGTEFGLLADQLGYGSRIEDALATMRNRIPCEDLRYLTIALVIHEKSGGNLTNTLRTLAEVIRQRHALSGKVRALSAEGRFSAKLMSVFPLIIYGVLAAISPNYYDELWGSGWKSHFVGFCVVMTLVGNFFISRMVKLEV